MSTFPPLKALVGTTAAAVAGFAYLDARLNLRSDLDNLLGRRAVFKELIKASRNKRVSFYCTFEDAVKLRGDTEAIWFHNESLSFNQVYARIHQYAQWFLSQGVKPDDFVIFYMVNSPDFLCAWVGLLAIGAAPALINTNLVGNALVHCAEIANAKLVLVDGPDEMSHQMEGVRPDLEATGHKIVMLKDVREHIYGSDPVRPADALRSKIQPTSPMALAYTSGTTGLPKAITFPTLIGFISTTVRSKGYSPMKAGSCERGYNCMPLYHLTGGLSALQTLGVGDTLCLAPKFHARSFWAEIRASRSTYFIYVGETLRYLLAQPPSPLDRAHNVHTIWGNGLRGDVWVPFRERFGITTIHEFYNSTEAMFGLNNPSRGDFTARSLGLHGALLRFLTRDMYAAVAVDAETGALVRDGAGFARRVSFEEGGEILVQLEPGSTVPGRDFRGYWRNEEATNKKIARDVFRKGDFYYRTGDAMRRDSDGRWFFCDRLGDTFRWKGENVATTEVAEVLGEYPGIVEANVYGVQLPGHDGRAGAVALLIEDAKKENFDFADFLQHCRTKLPKYAVPIFIRITNAAYSTGNHKQNKVPLKSEGVDPEQVSNGDRLYWIERGGKGNTYVPFTKEDWENLQAGKARL